MEEELWYVGPVTPSASSQPILKEHAIVEECTQARQGQLERHQKKAFTALIPHLDGDHVPRQARAGRGCPVAEANEKKKSHPQK